MKIYHFSVKRYLVLAITMFFLLLNSCRNNDPVEIGFISALSGRLSQLGVSCREALLITTEMRNENGGLNGRRIDIVIADDQSVPEVGSKELKKLVDEGISIIIGPLTSNMVPAVEETPDDVLVISPTISTSLLSGKDDNFITLIPSTAEQGNVLSRLLFLDKTRTAVVVYDSSNTQYTEDVLSSFVEEYEQPGFEVLDAVSFDGSGEYDAVALAEKVISEDPAGVVFISAGIDAAIIIQQLRKKGCTTALYGSRWSKTQDLIENGGRAVEGMKNVSEYTGKDSGNEFIKRYEAKVGNAPSFAAVYTHETARILFDAIENIGTLDTEKIKDEIINKEYRGIWENIKIDQYGDTFRNAAFSRIENNKFVVYPLND